MNIAWISAEPINPATYAAEAYARRQALIKPANAWRDPAAVEKPVKNNVFRLEQFTKEKRRRAILEDAHIIAYRQWKAIRPTGPAQRYIVKRCLELCVNYYDIVGKARYRRFVVVRHLIIWELKRLVLPGISYPQLARLFGHCDHTTCLYAVKKIDAQMARAGK